MQVDRASRFLKDHSLKKNSVCRRFFLLLVDLALVSGLCYLLWRIVKDQVYWTKAPYPLHIFIVAQYILLALLIRVPVMSCRAATTGWIACSLCILATLNVGLGLYWFNQLESQDDQQFELKPEYEVWTAVMIFVPISIIGFVIIVAVKIICFYLADQKQKRRRTSGLRYGEFEDEARGEGSEEAAATE
jgi:hypothetical protein